MSISVAGVPDKKHVTTLKQDLDIQRQDRGASL